MWLRPLIGLFILRKMTRKLQNEFKLFSLPLPEGDNLRLRSNAPLWKGQGEESLGKVRAKIIAVLAKFFNILNNSPAILDRLSDGHPLLKEGAVSGANRGSCSKGKMQSIKRLLVRCTRLSGLFFRCLLILWVLTVLLSCKQEQPVVHVPESIQSHKTVEIRHYGEKFVLYRHGKPFYIKGAAGRERLAELKAAGGNAIRTWNHYGVDTLLDRAQELGLTVTVGLYLRPERHGFDYRDSAACRSQREYLRQVVLEHKDHPALLMWGVGNEMELNGTDDIVWQEVNRVARMIHELDPNHPTTTMIMPLPRTATLIATEAPAIDIIAINTFGELATVPEKIRKPWYNWDGPYLIGEWGGVGWWECEITDWQAPIEMKDQQKVAFYQERNGACMAIDTTRCLGSYVFYWGQKQERTHSWFSLFLESGEKTALVDAMQEIWTGEKPENLAPQINRLFLDGEDTYKRIYLEPGRRYEALVEAIDPEGDALQYQWELRPEGEYLGMTGGDIEAVPQPLPNLIEQENLARIWLQSPDSIGAYRLFVTVLDGKGSGTVANAPFFVMGNSLP